MFYFLWYLVGFLGLWLCWFFEYLHEYIRYKAEKITSLRPFILCPTPRAILVYVLVSMVGPPIWFITIGMLFVLLTHSLDSGYWDTKWWSTPICKKDKT